MESSGWLRELIFYGSLILNLVLLVALFFRTAINEVVRDWWRERRQRKEEEKSLLHELHYHLNLYPAIHFSIMTQLSMMSMVRTAEEVRQIKSTYEKTEKMMEKFVVFTNSNELRFSDDIRAGLRELREAASVMDVLEGDYTRINGISQRVHDVSDRLKGLVEQELKRF